MKAPDQFYSPTPGVEIHKVDPKLRFDRERGIRLYCETSATTWNLQVRGPQTLAKGGEGPFIVATAPMSRAQMIGLRDAIDAFLAEADET